MRRLALIVLLLVGIIGLDRYAIAQETPDLLISFGGPARTFSASELLARKDVSTIAVDDVAYRWTVTYRAVPVVALIGHFDGSAVDTVEASATDGFVAQIPLSLFEGGAVPWIAIENPENPWPNLPDKDQSAGPFYLVWQHATLSGVKPRNWVYALAAIQGAASPLQRWPQIAVAASLPGDAPERLGQEVFVKNCLSCHRLDGAARGIWARIW